MKRSRKKQKKVLRILLALLAVAMILAAATVYNDYKTSPGILKDVWIAERGADHITLAWERPRNIYKYVIKYNGRKLEVSGWNEEVKIGGLEEDTSYEFAVRADSMTREGTETLTERARTRKSQTIEGPDSLMRFGRRAVDLKQSAITPVTYTAENGSVVASGDKVIFNTTGKINVIATAAETQEYISVSKKFTVDVLDSIYVDAGGADPHILYKLNADNCKRVMTIKGTKEAEYPQSFVKYNGEYIVTYVSKNDDQRIIRFSGSGKRKVTEPKTDMGHANGLTVADGLCYSVRGGFSGKVITYDPAREKYGEIELPFNASGIAYDETTDMYYTSSGSGLATYDSDFRQVNRFGRIKRMEMSYVQDCGAYGGIMLHCVSGPDPYGTNYIDFYEMAGGRYLGSAECELNEVESLIVDDEGYIELLTNAMGKKDYIWKTPINMKTLMD